MTVASRLTERERAIALAFGEAFFPAGTTFPAAGEASLARVEALLAGYGGPWAVRGHGWLLRWLDVATRVRRGARFERLTPAEREAELVRLLGGDVLDRLLLFALGFPLRNVHLDDPETFARIGCVWDRSAPAEPARWRQQVHRARDWQDAFGDEDIECDVVVVGTGAGGAVVAKELAEAGLAVVMVEEGEYHTREHFTGRAADGLRRLYKAGGATASVGNAVIWIPLGRTVGGTTTVNAGTSFRTPEKVLARWRDELGLAEVGPDRMGPYFDRVAAELRITTNAPQYLGGVARVVARGCEALGWSHHALPRNAPDCDGQGVCTFGCPSDAKRSTNVSYVPAALERAAVLVTGLRAERVLVENGRAVGIEGRVLGGAGGERRRVRARAVVLACGALETPAFLLRQKLANGSGHLGRNLTIHPAVAMSALFDEEILAYKAIPQGYCVDEFHDEGILMEGGSLPFENAATVLDVVGRELTELMERYDRVASFGAMVSERRGAGRVRLLPGGASLVEYWVSKEVLERLHLALARIGEIFLAAGARTLYPAFPGSGVLHDADELRAFAARRFPARSLGLTAYHPLGTCRLSRDAASGVVSPDHEVWDVPGLYVADGSVVPTSPTVNPQVTIMALATRAADRLAAKLA